MGKFKTQNFKRILSASMATLALFNSTNASANPPLPRNDVKNYSKMESSNKTALSAREVALLGIVGAMGIMYLPCLSYGAGYQRKFQAERNKHAKHKAKCRKTKTSLNAQLNSLTEYLDSRKQALSETQSELRSTKDKLEKANEALEQTKQSYEQSQMALKDFMYDSAADLLKIYRVFDGSDALDNVLLTLLDLCAVPQDKSNYYDTIACMLTPIKRNKDYMQCLNHLFLSTRGHRFWKTRLGHRSLGEQVALLYTDSIPRLTCGRRPAVDAKPKSALDRLLARPATPETYDGTPCDIKLMGDTDNVNVHALHILKGCKNLQHVCNVYDFTLGNPYGKTGTVVILEKMKDILNDDVLGCLLAKVTSIDEYYATVKDWSIQLFEGMRDLHILGLCHHAIHPGNIMFADDEMKTLKLVGLESATLMYTKGLTEKAPCTTGWDAPEAYNGVEKGLVYGEKVDVYSAAMTVAWLFQLCLPIIANTDTWPSAWKEFFSRCLEGNPKKRAGSDEALELLKKAWDSGNPPPSERVSGIFDKTVSAVPVKK